MKKKFFLFYGTLFWLPFKIVATVLTVTSLFATAGPVVDAVDVNTHINCPPMRVAAVIVADAGFTETKPGEMPDPEPPTTDGPWSEMISATPVGTVG